MCFQCKWGEYIKVIMNCKKSVCAHCIVVDFKKWKFFFLRQNCVGWRYWNINCEIWTFPQNARTVKKQLDWNWGGGGSAAVWGEILKFKTRFTSIGLIFNKTSRKFTNSRIQDKIWLIWKLQWNWNRSKKIGPQNPYYCVKIMFSQCLYK